MSLPCGTPGPSSNLPIGFRNFRGTPHVASGINFIDGTFQVNAPLETKFDRTRLWTRGKTFSESAGVSYLLTKRVALTVDAFYTPLSVRRTACPPRPNNGLSNVRSLFIYTLTPQPTLGR